MKVVINNCLFRLENSWSKINGGQFAIKSKKWFNHKIKLSKCIINIYIQLGDYIKSN
jgi:hypothetical protein